LNIASAADDFLLSDIGITIKGISGQEIPFDSNIILKMENTFQIR
jgi:hypothetical protein